MPVLPGYSFKIKYYVMMYCFVVKGLVDAVLILNMFFFLPDYSKS